MRRYLLLGAVIYGASAYGVWFWFSFVNPKEKRQNEAFEQTPERVDLTAIWDEKAEGFDSAVDLVEKTSCLWYLRRKLVKQAQGHVLEVSAGTGRNFKHYNLNACKSITFLDQSWPMLEIARRKWQEQHPQAPSETVIAFKKQAALRMRERPSKGYDTIVQTMGVCSTPQPAETLAHLGSLLNPETGRLLLIEHGRGYYNWINYILDRDAHRHAQKYGCYHNRDIESIVKNSGLVVEKMTRPFWWNLGTVWVIEARPHGWKDGKK